MKLWPKKPLPPVTPKSYRLEAIDTSEPVELLRIYTLDDYEKAFELGASSRADYRRAFAAGVEYGKAERPTWKQQSAIKKAEDAAYSKGLEDGMAVANNISQTPQLSDSTDS